MALLDYYKDYKKTFLRKFCHDDIDYACNLCPYPQRIFVTSNEEHLFDHLINEHSKTLKKLRR